MLDRDTLGHIMGFACLAHILRSSWPRFVRDYVGIVLSVGLVSKMFRHALFRPPVMRPLLDKFTCTLPATWRAPIELNQALSNFENGATAGAGKGEKQPESLTPGARLRTLLKDIGSVHSALLRAQGNKWDRRNPYAICLRETHLMRLRNSLMLPQWQAGVVDGVKQPEFLTSCALAASPSHCSLTEACFEVMNEYGHVRTASEYDSLALLPLLGAYFDADVVTPLAVFRGVVEEFRAVSAEERGAFLKKLDLTALVEQIKRSMYLGGY